MTPILAIPILMGGVLYSQFLKVGLALCNTLFLACGVSLLVSTLARSASVAITLSGLALAYQVVAIPLLVDWASWATPWRSEAMLIGLVSPSISLVAALETSFVSAKHFWWSVLCNHAVAWLCLAAAWIMLPRQWQDRPVARKSPHSALGGRRGRWGWCRLIGARRGLVRRPMYWLAAPEQVSSLGTLLLLFGVVAGGTYLCGYIGRIGGFFFTGQFAPFEGYVFGWMWVTMIVHGIVLLRAGLAGARRFTEDRQSGAFEFLMSTPVTPWSILWGHWLGYCRQMAAPALVALIVHGLLVYGVLGLFIFDFGQWRSPWEILWARYVTGAAPATMEWQIVCLMTDFLLLAACVLAVLWALLGWVGMWAALRFRTPRFAPWIALGLVIAPPIPMVVTAVYQLSDIQPAFGDEFSFIRVALAMSAGIVFAHFALVGLGMGAQLLRHFRGFVVDRDALPDGKARRRFIRRLAIGAGAVFVCLWLVYQIEGWRGARYWRAVEQRLVGKIESLRARAAAPKPIPSEENVFGEPPFNVLHETWPQGGNRTAEQKRIEAIDVQQWRGTAGWAPEPMVGPSPNLREFAEFLSPPAPGKADADGQARQKIMSADEAARSILNSLQPVMADLDLLRRMAERPEAQIKAGMNGGGAFWDQGWRLSRMAKVVALRALAELKLGNTDAAVSDTWAVFRLDEAIGYATAPDVIALRSGILSMAGCVIREGIQSHQWDEEQLNRFEAALKDLRIEEQLERALAFESFRRMAIWDNVRTGDWGANNDAYYMVRTLHPYYPDGWCDINKAHVLEFYGDQLSSLIDIERGHVDWRRLQATVQEYEQSGSWIRFRGVTYSTIVSHCVQIVQLAELTQTACALERYYLARGEYPESLEQLAPQFVESQPASALTEEPLGYERSAQDAYALRIGGLKSRAPTCALGR